MTPDVEAVLAAHADCDWISEDGVTAVWSCGATTEAFGITDEARNRAHVAAELDPLLQNARAEGWDEAVKALAWCLIERHTHPDVGLPYVAKNNPYRQEPDHD